MKKGRDLILKIGNTALTASRSCSLDEQQDMIEVCHPTDGRARKYVPGLYGWTVSAECLITEFANIATFTEYIREGTELDISFTDEASATVLSGKAYVKSVSASGAVSGLATMSVSLQGNGLLLPPDEEE